jgi:hypothetical protein
MALNKKFKPKQSKRNPFCANSANCRGLCTCRLAMGYELSQNRVCPKHASCKQSAGCSLTVASPDCPVCQGNQTDYEILSSSGAKILLLCPCNTCSRQRIARVAPTMDPISFMIHTPDGLGLTITTNHNDYDMYMKKFRLLGQIDACK